MRINTAFRGAVRAAAPALALAVAGLTAACADSPLAPGAPVPSAASFAKGAGANRGAQQTSGITDRRTDGDTVVTTFVLRPDGQGATVPLGHGHMVNFPAGAQSVCDPATSGYGLGTWDDACQPLAEPVTITAKSWRVGGGLPHVEFDRDVRFVPRTKGVVLYMKNPLTRFPSSGEQVIAYCPDSGTRCIDESLADPSVATREDAANGFWSRRLKHFSGYTVVANRSAAAY